MEFACTKVAIIKMEEHLMNLSCIFGVEPIGTEDGLLYYRWGEVE